MMTNKDQTIRYILERRCSNGGYCFYRLDEPNCGDTFYAITSLEMLGALPTEDEATSSFLHSFQQNDGGFSNVHIGYTVIRSLISLGDRSFNDPSDWITSSLVPPVDSARPIESSSLFWHMYLLMDLSLRCSVTLSKDKKEEVIHTALRYQHPDRGFGYPRSTLIETAHALSILAAVRYPVTSTESEGFLKRCEDKEFGYLGVPGTKPSFLEHIHAGMLASSVLGSRFPIFLQCREFVMKCFVENGGYVRSIFGGAATLENTYLALDTLRMIKLMEQDNRCVEYNQLRCFDSGVL
ncbi:hypothetical protein [Methanocalculus sp.]|uniref:prenyltransferase/squalene oxidase repeat-containing protein n=1 Tax=Methanocalculus sp. TaxID=2004547 RepID=UPI002727BEA2|nr:hypothetical protein [Methanocalculus sp.]MDO8841500.1 hypothetical protein [Methanocalculus sp.]